MEILTVSELAAMLKMNKRQVYSMTCDRARTGPMKDHPIPVLRINGNLRFSKNAVLEWLAQLAGEREAA